MTGHSVTTGEFSARINPQAYTQPRTNGTGSVAQPRARPRYPVVRPQTEDEYVCALLCHIIGTKCPNRFFHECCIMTRWINVGISFGVDLQNIFKVGMRLSIAEDYDSVSYAYVMFFELF